MKNEAGEAVTAAQEAKVQLIDEGLFQELLMAAAGKERLRTNYNFHQTLSENPNRFLNVMLKGTYITPHRHGQPPKSESFVLLGGEVAFFLFYPDGRVQARYDLCADGPLRGIDIGPGIWHSLVVLSDNAVCFEVKPGPYIDGGDKEFAPWAPAEGSPNCQEYLESLLSHPQS